MKTFAIGLLIILGAGNSNTADWRGFFAIVVPASAHDFTSLRGTFDAKEANYAPKRPLSPRVVRNCIIFAIGALDQKSWDLRCELTGYAGEAAGPGTSPNSALVRDLSAALPNFHLSSNGLGEPQWKSGTITITIVFGGILVTHGFTGM